MDHGFLAKNIANKWKKNCLIIRFRGSNVAMIQRGPHFQTYRSEETHWRFPEFPLLTISGKVQYGLVIICQETMDRKVPNQEFYIDL